MAPRLQIGFCPTEGGQFYREALEEIVRGEELGLDSVWIAEHHGVRDHYWPAPIQVLTGFATRTSRVTLGANVAIFPFYHPVRLAEEVALLDVISSARATACGRRSWLSARRSPRPHRRPSLEKREDEPHPSAASSASARASQYDIAMASNASRACASSERASSRRPERRCPRPRPSWQRAARGRIPSRARSNSIIPGATGDVHGAAEPRVRVPADLDLEPAAPCRSRGRLRDFPVRCRVRPGGGRHRLDQARTAAPTSSSTSGRRGR